MVTVIAGIVLIICAILLWVGALSLAHALAIFIGIIGLAMILWYAVPNGYSRRTVR